VTLSSHSSSWVDSYNHLLHPRALEVVVEVIDTELVVELVA
jgi:hypothetical protein